VTQPKSKKTTTSTKSSTKKAPATTKSKSGSKATKVAKKAPPAKKAVAKKTVAKKAVVKTTPAKKVAGKSAAPAKKLPAVKKVGTAKIAVVKPARVRAARPKVVKVKPAPVIDTSSEVESVPMIVRNSAEWGDMNKRMFIERAQLKKEIEALEASSDRIEQRSAVRKRRQYQDITMKIVESNYGLLRKYVRLFTGSASREDAKDFEAAGRLGLMRAIDNYDPYRGSFAQWAFKPIQREVLRAVHSADHNNMNPGDFERRPEILRALKKLQGENEDVKPTEAQVAAEAGVTIEQVKRVLYAPRMDSLYTPVGDSEGTLGDMVEDKGAGVEDAVLNSIGVEALTNYGLSALDPREYFVLSRRLGLDCEPEQRLSAIGEMLKLSREAVRQIESKAIAKMSHPVLLRQLVRNGKK
jgi:RNA polymerase sigma factor (sigma-70 family)